ncbi:MAG: phosphoribosyltransferase [Thaumarchaeota archaeon]|nr:phosphoribosyltransferase [Nitrososphaerota archaeon]
MTKNDWKGSSYLTWKEIEQQVLSLVKKIEKTGFEFNKIATVSRGGLVPARLVADYFNIKTIQVDGKKISQKTLFVDDIYDSGNTFRKISPRVEHPKKFLYATLVARKGVKYPKNLVYGKKTHGCEYVVFPWDRLEFERSHLTKD